MSQVATEISDGEKFFNQFCKRSVRRVLDSLNQTNPKTAEEISQELSVPQSTMWFALQYARKYNLIKIVSYDKTEVQRGPEHARYVANFSKLEYDVEEKKVRVCYIGESDSTE